MEVRMHIDAIAEVPDTLTIFNMECEGIADYESTTWKCTKKSSNDNEVHTIDIILYADGTVMIYIDDYNAYEDIQVPWECITDANTIDEYLEDAVDWVEENFEKCVSEMEE